MSDTSSIDNITPSPALNQGVDDTATGEESTRAVASDTPEVKTVKGDSSHSHQSKPLPEALHEDASEMLPGSSSINDNGCTRCRGCGNRDTCKPGNCHIAPRNNLTALNWLADTPRSSADTDLIEVSFKNTRKGFYRNSDSLPVEIGELIVVEAAPGYDIGKITMVGPLVAKQMVRSGMKEIAQDALRKLLRKPSAEELEKYEEVRQREHDTMIRARKIAEELGLNMKIGDVEYQADGNKAIFYYIADERVDFRQLIRVLAEKFRVRVEMRQIGARQEAGRIGGIGPCGRPLCCATWLTNFVSVTTAAARFQDLSLNMQKLAGQCGKLKCCLNYEVDTYLDALRQIPDKNTRLETIDGVWYPFKVDVFKKEFTYSSDRQMAANLVTIDSERVREIARLNGQGEKPASLLSDDEALAAKKKKTYNDILEEGNLNRFDNKKKKKKKKQSSGAVASDGTMPSSSSAPNQRSSKNNSKTQPKQSPLETKDSKQQPQQQPSAQKSQEQPKTQQLQSQQRNKPQTSQRSQQNNQSRPPVSQGIRRQNHQQTPDQQENK